MAVMRMITPLLHTSIICCLGGNRGFHPFFWRFFSHSRPGRGLVCLSHVQGLFFLCPGLGSSVSSANPSKSKAPTGALRIKTYVPIIPCDAAYERTDARGPSDSSPTFSHSMYSSNSLPSERRSKRACGSTHNVPREGLDAVCRNAMSSSGSLDSHLPIPGPYFLNKYSLSPVTAHHGLVLKRWVKKSANSPDWTTISPKGEYS